MREYTAGLDLNWAHLLHNLLFLHVIRYYHVSIVLWLWPVRALDDPDSNLIGKAHYVCHCPSHLQVPANKVVLLSELFQEL